MSEMLGNIFLGCFVVGFVLTSASLLFGIDQGSDFGGHDVGGHHFGGHDAGPGSHAGGDLGDHAGHGQGLPFFSYYSMVMFLTWFGGIGYILHRNSTTTLALTLLIAAAGGLAGATIVFLFLGKFLLKGETRMNPRDYYMPGTLGRVTSSIREGGTGEIVYVQGGTRKTAGARSEDGCALGQGTEVVVVRYEKGIAYVKSVPRELGREGAQSAG